MINILHNHFSIDADWCYPEFSKYIKSNYKVVVVPLSFRDSQISSKEQWQTFYGRNSGKYYNGIVSSLYRYGIYDDCIEWINYFEDNTDDANSKIRSADILYFPGGLPDKMYERIINLDILNSIKTHKGLVIGFSAGAMIQLDEYHISPDKDYPEYCYHKGCGLLSGFDIEVHYCGTHIQKEAIHRFISERKKGVFAIPDDGALIFDGNRLYTLGDVEYFE